MKVFAIGAGGQLGYDVTNEQSAAIYWKMGLRPI